ncbi:DUF4381 domain-containing protein [Thiomicrorhabdus sediminis]|uniref:DUF4381 domain-containing protein n=1 Tax=Thiomicrorhabdus sediminis TaxID=2580412 RepID=A0A4P9K2X9_9GAMM|nr:DUF4381 domain-containing protein [Thiomicrorhabdus sediminis]QCU89178.1 DUF4381 domain-containing protein [Thiomicrorhabdus sediminis]
MPNVMDNPNNLNDATQLSAALGQQLHDIQLPDPVGWWPLSYSSWLLIFALIMAIVGVTWYFLEQKRRNRYRHQALKKLQVIQQAEHLSANEKIAEINQLVKQVALSAYGRNATAALIDQAWLDFLQNRCKFIAQPDNLNAIMMLGYQERTEIQIANQQTLSVKNAVQIWYDYAYKWIKGHHQ